MSDSKSLRGVLKSSGYSDAAIDIAWPNWWSDEAEQSISAQAELRFSVARKLGIDPRSLLYDEGPEFTWKDEAKFKHLSTETDNDRATLSSYGISVGRALITGAQVPEQISLVGANAQTIRKNILASQNFVDLQNLLALCWGIGVPVVHLRVFPLAAKRMCAMSVGVGNRFAVLLGKDSTYPAPIAFHLAHELGHIALGHLSEKAAVVDFGDPLQTGKETDHEEVAADRFALELLTGMPEPFVNTETVRFTASQLADNLRQTGKELNIEPGTLALCFGYSTGKWEKAYASMRLIYRRQLDVWKEVNSVASFQISWADIPEDLAYFVRAVMGGISDDSRGN